MSITNTIPGQTQVTGILPGPKRINNPITELTNFEVYRIQSQKIRLITGQGEEKLFAYAWLKGEWKWPRPGCPTTFCFVGAETHNYLKKSNPSLKGIFEALYIKSKLLQSRAKWFEIYDNSTPEGEDPLVYAMAENGDFSHKQKLQAYLDFRII